MYTYRKQDGGDNILLTGKTSLVDTLMKLQEQLDVGLIDITGISSVSVVGYLSSPGYTQILAVKQYLSSMLINSVYNEDLLSEVLAQHGYSTISDYQKSYTDAVQNISHLRSTSIGLKAINDLSGSAILPFTQWQYQVAQIEYGTDAAAYSTIVFSQSTLSSLYISTSVVYSAAVEDYIRASTIEHESTSTLSQEYSEILAARWSTIQTILGSRWLNMNSQEGGGEVTDILAAYSSIQLEDSILFGISAVNYYSTLQSTINTTILEYKNNLSSYIVCDYSTIVSTYVENIMGYKDEILQCTTGELRNNVSTMIGYSTLWLSASQGDSDASAKYATSISTYNYYSGLINNLSAHIGQLSTIYKSTLFSFQTWERICSTHQTLVTFLQLEQAEVNAQSLFASTNTLKTELASMLNLLTQGADIDSRYNSAQETLQSLQQGGAASASDVQNMLNTVEVMYNNYSTIYASTTRSRAAAQLPPDTATIYANTLSTQIGICDARIAIATDKYDKDVLSSLYLSQQISSLNGYLSSYTLTSTITDGQVSSLYSTLYSQYTTELQTLMQQKISTQYQISKCVNSVLVSSVTVDTVYNTIEQLILRLQTLGYTMNVAQQGGDTAYSGSAVSKADHYLREISATTLSYSASGTAGLIGEAAQAVSAATRNYNMIVKSIDDLRKAASPENISSGTYLNVRNAVQALNTNAAKYYQYSQIIYGYSYSTSYFKYSNYLDCLRILSSQLTTNLLENRDEITKIQWISSQRNASVLSYGITSVTGVMSSYISSSSSGTVVATADFNTKIQTLSTNSQNIRNYRVILQSFINTLIGEEFSRNYYLLCKSTFEGQERYRLQQGIKPSDMMSAYDFDQLTLTYDVSIQNVNRYISYRQTMFTPFVNATGGIVNSLRPDVVYGLKSVTDAIMPPPSHSITSSLLMEFAPVLPRVVFPKGGIPTTTLIDCPPPSDSDQSAIRTTTYPDLSTTTTADSVTRGVKGRYINISKPDGSFEILQVLVIDAKGKNVAFGKPVSGTTTTANPLLSAIVNGQYSADVPADFQPYFKHTLDSAIVLQIDLLETYDITCIRYIKSAASTYDSRGLRFDILNSSSGPSLKSATLAENTPIEDCDVRIDPDARKYINPSRKGACGYMGRHLTLSKSDGMPFTLSQVAVVSSKGINPAKGKPVKKDNGAAAISPITDGTYCSRPRTSCVYASKFELDLGSEVDVIAVHLYGVSDGDQDLQGVAANLYTEDKLLAYVQTATTINKKQILDFRYISASFINPACKTDLQWPAYYGEAGIICRYIRLKKQGRLGFTKIKVVDKSGRDVALFKPVTASSEAVADSRFLGVNDRNESGPLSESYSSVGGDAEQSYEIDLERPFEICSITIFRCSDEPSFMNDVQIQIFGNNRAGPPSVEFSSPSGNTTIFYDTRYDPDEHGSSYATDSVSTSRSYATFGTLALTVEIPGYVSSMQITEGTGQNLLMSTIEKTITYTPSSTTAIRFKNLREVNSVVLDSLPIGTRVILRDCDGYIVNNKTVQNFSTPTGVHRLADFRNPFQPPYIKNVAPMLPIAFKTLGAGWSDVNGIYTGTTNGVAARYVKVMPPSANSSLYVSQIIVIDSRGINVAFQKDTFTTDSAQVTKTARVVDGVYEPKLDETTPTILSYENYICRTAANSFVSGSGTYWVVDLGEEYLINSVVYVGVEGRYADSVNTIIELFDATLNQTAIQVVSTYVTIFGVDILDFRVDRNKSASSPGNYLEVRPRQIAVGCSGCGLMAQYIRIKGTNIRLSQIIAIDSAGKNQALYMPTYTNIDLENSYKLVDGKYYQKMENPVQGETEAYIMQGSGYIEVNFGQEVEIVAVFLIPTVESPLLSNLTIQIYNKFRDTIATLNPTYNTRNFSNISLLSDSNSLVYPSPTKIIGVNIIKKFADFKIQAGLMSADVLSGENMPPLNFGCSTSPVAVTCAEELKVVPRFTRGPNGGIPTRYLRVYNVSKYVQVSQIMAYGADGTNYAYQKEATSESIFPGTYPSKATDGLGGYYHNARTCADSYKSEGNLYGFLEIDLGESASSTPFEIVGLRCVFPSDNPGQNIGTRIHLLDKNLFVLAQYVVGNGISLYNSSKYEFEELIVDYRVQPVATPIDKIIMPKIASLTGFGTTPSSPNGIAEVCGKIYVADTLANRILVNDGTTFSSSALLSYPTGLVSDGTDMYVASYGNDTIIKIPIGSPGSASVLCSAPKPYGLCLNEGTLYITSYGGPVSNYYTYNVGVTMPSTCTVMHGGQATTPAALARPLSTPLNFPNSVAHIGSNTLLISSLNDKCVHSVITTSGVVSKYIGATGATIRLMLAAPSAISYDAKTKILFISDYVQNRIYSARIDPSKPYQTENMAGNGRGGFSGDGAQGSLATFDGPMNILYSSNKGYLYISDYNNRKVRILNIYSQPPATIASTTTSPQWADWTTTTLAAQTLSQATLSSAQYVEAAVTPTGFSTITSPSQISDIQSVTGITTYYFFNNTHYYCANGSVFKIGTATPIRTGLGVSPITMDNGFLYLCDSVNKCIWKENSAGSGTFSKYIGTGAGIQITYSFVNITYIGFDRRRRLYVVDGDSILRMNKFNNGLEKYVGGGDAIYSGSDYGTKIKLISPGAFTFDSQNNLIFVEYAQETVFKVADANGIVQHICRSPSLTKNYADQLKAESAFPVPVAETYNIRTPFGITVDSADNLYVTSMNAHQILKLIPNTVGTYSIDIVAGLGSIINNLSTNTAAQDILAKYAQLNNPTYIYFSGSGIYFSELWGKIRRITAQTQTSQPITTILPYGPVSIIANYSRNTYNTSEASYNFMFKGWELGYFTYEEGTLMLNFSAKSICCDMMGNIYFCGTTNIRGGGLQPIDDNGELCIFKMDSAGNTSLLIENLSELYKGIANYKDTFLYVTNGTNIRSLSISTKQWQSKEYPLAGCSNIAISPVGLMHVSNNTNNIITVYNLKTEKLLRTITVTEAATINSLCVDADLNLYVGTTNTNVYKIFKYDSADNKTSTGNLGYTVTGIAYSNGALYYLTTAGLYKINGTSMALAPTRLIGQDKQKAQASDGAYGNTTTLNNPVALCLDINENIYIVDKVGTAPDKTVILKNTTFTPLQDSLVYNITGTNAQGQIIPDMSAYLENFSSIQGICYDSVGNIYISDSGQNTISKIDLTGKLTTFAGRISTSGSYSGDDGSSVSARLNNPTDIKMSKSDVLYIADTNNNAIRRVKIYEGGNFQIETYIPNVLKPSALAIDSYENLYVVTGASTIAVISPITETLSTVVNTGFNVSALAVNSLDQVYYTGNGALRQLGSAVSSAFTQPTGLAIDASNKIYVSDSAQNKVFSVVGATITPEVGNGESETAVNATEGLAENIYGSGVPPLTAAVSAPRALAVNSSRGLLVAQATKVLLKPVVNYGTTFNCGITSGTLTITNTGGSGPLYLSQVVALNTSGTNILLNRSGASYLDGFYGCKGVTPAHSIISGTPLTIPISGTVTCILIYVGSTNKTRWNGASITFGSETRFVSGMTENPSTQYILLDYRTKTPACTPFINYVNKYKLQTTSNPTTEPFRIQYARYVRIVSLETKMTMRRIYAIHGETGEDLLSGKFPYTNLNLVENDRTFMNDFTGSGAEQEFPPGNNNIINFWIEYDLGDEYPIEQVIIQQKTLPGKYDVALYTSNRTQVKYPSTFNRLDGRFASVVVQGASPTPTLTAPVNNIASSSSTTINSISYITYNVQQDNLPNRITFTTASQRTVYVMYNQAGEEVTRSLLTYSPYFLPTQSLTTLSYSFTPIIGLRRIRYIRANAAISQIRVFDSNGVNASNGKTVVSNRMDLGQEYELIQLVCTSAATSTTITFLDAFQIQQRQDTISGTSINIDLRTTTRFVALPTVSSTTTTDTSLTGSIVGRYVRIENARPGDDFSVTTPNIYDIYGKNLVAGKTISTSSPSTDYGASWEIDLGQEYPIRDIVYSGSINAVAIYNRYRAESWRNYTNGPMTAPLVPVPVPTGTTGTAIRYIRIVGACTINHVAAIDTRGIDVAIWKPVRIVSGTATPYTTTTVNTVTVSYTMFNGLYSGSDSYPSPSINEDMLVTVSTFSTNNNFNHLDYYNNPTGIAVDSIGNVFVVDRYNNQIRKITPGGVVTTLAGSGSSEFANGIGQAASFKRPQGVAVDAVGNLFVGDSENHRIRIVTPGGIVSTLAGNGSAGFANGIGTSASFNYPYGIAVDLAGNIIVADTGNNRIRKVTPGGAVSTLAGSGSAEFADGIGAAASFNSPTNVAVDKNGNIIVADTGNHCIRIVTPGGIVSTLAGSGINTFADGIGTAAAFNEPTGLAIDAIGNIIVADTGNHRIRIVTSGGIVSTLAGNGSVGFADGTSGSVSFNFPRGVAVDLLGNVFIADTGNNGIRQISYNIRSYGRLEIDLAMSYNINNIKVYLSAVSNPKVYAYNAEGNVVPFTGTFIQTFLTTISTALEPYPNWGTKARYVGINTTAANAEINNLVVTDSLGRNLAFINSAKSSNGNFISNFGKTYSRTTSLSLPTTYTELDLGEEHYITSVSVYSKNTGTLSLTSLPTADTKLQGATVTLMDAYYNRVPRALAGLGTQYNNTWPLGASLGAYYQSPPAGVTAVSGTDGAIWSFPITEDIIETCVTSVPTTIYAMAVSSTDTIYYTTDSGVHKVSVTQSITHPNSPFIGTNSIPSPRGIALSPDETQLWICSPTENKVYVYNTSNGSLIKSYGGAETAEGLSCQLNTADRPIPSPAPTINFTNCSFKYPIDISISDSGFAYVADRDNYLIRVIDPTTNSVSTDSGTTVCEQKEVNRKWLNFPGNYAVLPQDRQCWENGWVKGDSLWDNNWYCPPDPNYKIIRIVVSTVLSSWDNDKAVHDRRDVGVNPLNPILGISFAEPYTDGYYNLIIPTGITLVSSYGPGNGPGNFVWPGIQSNSNLQWPITISAGSQARLRTNQIGAFRNKKLDLTTSQISRSTLYFHDKQNNTIRRSRRIQRTGYCEATLSTPVPLNTFALTKRFNRTPYSTDISVSSARIIPISGNYPATTNTALYPNGTQGAGINNQYYALPDKPFVGPYNNSTTLPLVDPAGQFFVTATFSESFDFTPPGKPNFTITSITNTGFVLTVTSAGSDYATSYTYSLNGAAALSLSTTPTVISSAVMNNIIIVYGENSNGSTSASSSFRLSPPFPGNFTVSHTLSSTTAINISWTQSTGVEQYNYSWSDTAGGSNSGYVNSGATSIQISPTPNSTFTFNINSQNLAADGTPQITNASPISGGVPSPQVTNVRLSAWTASQITVAWTGSTGATSYTCTIANSTSPSTIITTTTVNASTLSTTFSTSITSFTQMYIIKIVANNSTTAKLPAVTYTTSVPRVPVIEKIEKSGTLYTITWTGGELTATTTSGISYFWSTTPSSGFTSFTPSFTSPRSPYAKTATILPALASTLFTGAITTIFIQIRATYLSTIRSSNVFTFNK